MAKINRQDKVLREISHYMVKELRNCLNQIVWEGMKVLRFWGNLLTFLLIGQGKKKPICFWPCTRNNEEIWSRTVCNYNFMPKENQLLPWFLMQINYIAAFCLRLRRKEMFFRTNLRFLTPPRDKMTHVDQLNPGRYSPKLKKKPKVL